MRARGEEGGAQNRRTFYRPDAMLFRRRRDRSGRSNARRRHGGLVARQLAVPEEENHPALEQQLSPSSRARTDVGAEPVRGNQAADRRPGRRRDVRTVRLFQLGTGRTPRTL